MANHIQNLTAERDEALAEIERMKSELIELEVYLTSHKFYEDNTVQIRTDILPKISRIRAGF